jgi:hypothetical protein
MQIVDLICQLVGNVEHPVDPPATPPTTPPTTPPAAPATPPIPASPNPAAPPAPPAPPSGFSAVSWLKLSAGSRSFRLRSGRGMLKETVGWPGRLVLTVRVGKDFEYLARSESDREWAEVLREALMSSRDSFSANCVGVWGGRAWRGCAVLRFDYDLVKLSCPPTNLVSAKLSTNNIPPPGRTTHAAHPPTFGSNGAVRLGRLKMPPRCGSYAFTSMRPPTSDMLNPGFAKFRDGSSGSLKRSQRGPLQVSRL